MKKRTILGLAMATAMGATAFVSLASADEAPSKTDESNARPACCDKACKPVNATQVHKDGFAAIQAMHAARMAIFEGETERATEFLSTATQAMQAAISDGVELDSDCDLVPIDGRITLAKSFVPTEEHAKVLGEASQHLMVGNSDAAIKQLRAEGIDIEFSRVLMPVKTTQSLLEKAVRLTGEQKYYEANLALKEAEQGLTYDSVSLSEAPQNG